MDKKKIIGIFVCTILVVVALVVCIRATNKSGDDKGVDPVDSSILSAKKEDSNKQSNKKNGHKICGILLTSGTDKMNKSQQTLIDKQKIYGEYDKKECIMQFEGLDGIIYGDKIYHYETYDSMQIIFDKNGEHGGRLNIVNEFQARGGTLKDYETKAYVCPDEEYYVYVNPIYEDSEGKMYVTPSDTMYTLEKVIPDNKVGVIEKPFMTIKINSGDYSDNEREQYINDIAINLEYRQMTKQLKVYAFDKNDKKIDVTSYEVKGKPLTVKKVKGAEYYKVEEYCVGGQDHSSDSLTLEELECYDIYYGKTGVFLNGENITVK